jgi:hypothetical protein
MDKLDLEKYLQGRRPIACAKLVYDVESKLETVGNTPPLNFVLQNDAKIGDCTLHKGATFSYSIDGSNGWFAKVSSTDTGDEMGIDVLVFDKSNPCNNPGNFEGLLTLVGHYQKDIHDANQIKDWQQIFGIGANIFSSNIGPLEVYTQAVCIQLACAC